MINWVGSLWWSWRESRPRPVGNLLSIYILSLIQLLFVARGQGTRRRFRKKRRASVVFW